MHSSTSNSEAVLAREPIQSLANAEIPYIEPPERPVPQLRVGVAAITAVIVFVTALGAWEMYWRNFGAVPSYRNSEGLWAMQRRRVDNGEGRSTVLIGSSRTLSNVQLDVWERLDGKRPIQLAMEGTSPIVPLEQLADDPDFNGRLIIGVSPGLFFSGYQFRGDVFEYYLKETPSQQWGQLLSMWLIEPYAAHYDPDFSLFTVLKRQPWPQRPGAPARMEVRKLFLSERDRNMHLWNKVEDDIEYQNLAKSIWAQNFFRRPSGKELEEAKKTLQRQIDRAVVAVEKLKRRGVDVTFVLHPVDGEFAKSELTGMHRSFTWEPLLQRTGVPGIHFQDYPELQGLNLPEWSHLSAADARIYTERLYAIIERNRAGAATQAGR